MTRNKTVVTRRGLLAVGAGVLAASRWPLGTLTAAADTGAGDMITAEPWSSENRFLVGAFRPVFDERDDTDLAVEGEIPPGLRGVFMRNGPNPQFQPDGHYAYPFDGTGMVHALYLENGKARYRNRWVVTQELAAERAAGRRLYNSTFSPPPHADLANTNIVRHAGRYLALYEGGVPYELDRDLATVGLFNYGGKLPSVMSAHPKLDPVTGELLSIAYNWQTGALVYLRASRTGTLDRILPFQAPWGAMVHDIAITERHVIAFICPLIYAPSQSGPPVTWQPDKGAMVAVIPRDAQAESDVQWIAGAPFFNFHTMNAFAEGNRIEVVFPWYDSYSLTAPAQRLELHRMVIDTDAKTFQDQIIDTQACDFTRVNDAYLGRKARYGYAGLRDPRPGDTRQGGAFEAIARYDLTTGAKTVHLFPNGATVCEPVFVADPQGKAEEDGFIFTFVHDLASEAGSFQILDARNLAADPIAIVRLPRRVPAGLHGSWMPA